jgi:ABC-type sulfate transport system permease component
MTGLFAAAAVVAALVVGVVAGWAVARVRHRTTSVGAGRVHRILLPFTGTTISSS